MRYQVSTSNTAAVNLVVARQYFSREAFDLLKLCMGLRVLRKFGVRSYAKVRSTYAVASSCDKLQQVKGQRVLPKFATLWLEFGYDFVDLETELKNYVRKVLNRKEKALKTRAYNLSDAQISALSRSYE